MPPDIEVRALNQENSYYKAMNYLPNLFRDYFMQYLLYLFDVYKDNEN